MMSVRITTQELETRVLFESLLLLLEKKRDYTELQNVSKFNVFWWYFVSVENLCGIY